MAPVETNPCLKVAKLKLDNQRYRYLMPEEEPRLRAVLTGQRAHLADLVPVAIGTGLRKNELLMLQAKHIDFARGLILVTGTKTRKNREVPMNSEVRDIMLRGELLIGEVYQYHCDTNRASQRRSIHSSRAYCVRRGRHRKVAGRK